ncbi:MAG: MOSC N-terminal beta barrel domain-containing protein [Pirellulales bacterium]|nr:MOSC N-terminal beta barrel domain-containing protein [Pirellulales bacterium]
MPTLTRITIFPIKSFDGHDVREVKVLPGGALAGDRRYALIDGLKRFVNGKRCAAIHQIRATYSDDLQNVTLMHGENHATFNLATAGEELANWCGDVLQQTCRLAENRETGFPDDCEAPGPTLISTASLAEVAGWFDGIDVAESRRRFRMNLEIDGDTPFWEDQLVAEHRHKISRFQIGDVIWQGRGACQRCAVPTRDAYCGRATPRFAQQFSERRQACLPGWAPVERFDHFYRLGVNTGLDSMENGNIMRVGDSVTVLG